MRSVLTAFNESYGDKIAYKTYDLDPMVPLQQQKASRDFGINSHPYIAIVNSEGQLVEGWYGEVDLGLIKKTLTEAGMSE